MSHDFYILASYAVATLGLGALSLYLVLDYRSQQRALADLEARGLRRRSQRARA